MYNWMARLSGRVRTPLFRVHARARTSPAIGCSTTAWNRRIATSTHEFPLGARDVDCHPIRPPFLTADLFPLPTA